jgi:hypothetical protein
MDKYYNYLKYINRINSKITFNSINNLELNNIIGGKFISNEIKNEIINPDLYNYYTFEYEYNDINNIIYLGILKSDNNLHIFIKQLNIVSKILIFLSIIGKKKYPLRAYIFLSNHKKISNGDKFDPININSGYTRFTMLDSFIVVYRKEEFIKVLIHEAIHFFKLDIHFNQFGLLNSYLPFQFKSDDIITEAFTDFYAINYYIIFIFLYTNKKTYDDFIKIYQQQFEFIKKQAINIIQLSKVNITNTIHNNTNVFSYFVLKYILFEIYLKHKTNFLKLDKENFKIIINIMIKFIQSIPNTNSLKDNNIPLTMTFTF